VNGLTGTTVHLKEEIRILGLDDAPQVGPRVLVVGTVFRMGEFMEGALTCHVERDGNDVTGVLANTVTNSRFYPQLRVVMTDGLTFAGFNVLDIGELARKTSLPVIAVMRDLPDMASIEKALRNLPRGDSRLQTLLAAGEPLAVVSRPKEAPVYVQCAGIEPADAEEVVRLSATRSRIPEPLRAAHIFASAAVMGESRGRV